MLDYVIEHIDKLPLSSDDKLDLFRILAEMCPFCTEFDRPKERLGKLFAVLMVNQYFCRRCVPNSSFSPSLGIPARATYRVGRGHRRWHSNECHAGFSVLLHRVLDVCIASTVKKVSRFPYRRRERRTRQRLPTEITLSLPWSFVLHHSIEEFIERKNRRRRSR